LLGDRFDELAAPFLRDFEELAIGFLAGIHDRAEVVGVDDLLHREEIHDAEEIRFGTDRNLDRHGARAEAFANLIDAIEEVRAHTIHLIYEDDARHFVLIRLAPDGLGLRLHGGDRIEERDEAVEHAEAPFDFDCEVHVARRVDNIDTRLAPRAGRCGRRDRDTAFLFLDHPVHRGRAVVNFTDFMRAPGVVQDAFGSGRFARVDMRGNTDIARVLKGIFACD